MVIVIKKRWKVKMYSLVLFTLMFLAALSFFVKAPPSPKNVEGKVFANGSNGVQNGIPVNLNTTVSNDYVTVYTDAPDGIPDLRGIYSATVSGEDNELVIGIAWNLTHWGLNSTLLAPTTTNLNIVINTTRPSEANVTILYPLNHSVINKTRPFNVTANVTMLGSDGIDCNATIKFFENSTINITAGENLTHALGNMPFQSSKVINWSVIGLSEGVANISVSVRCSSDGRNFDGLNVAKVNNITIRNLAPLITRISIDPFIDLIAGSNATVLCNATITDPNTVLDIKSVNATFYQRSTGNGAPDDNNNHYTNSTCLNTSTNEFESNYSCGFRVAYYANNGTWQCNVTVSDLDNLVNSSNITTVINELLAIEISPTIIDYGSIPPTNTSPTDVNVSLINAGNVPINVTVRGFAPNESIGYLNLSMTCPKGNISNANHRFSTNHETSFDSMTIMNNESQLIRNVVVPQRINDFAQGNDTNTTFWKVRAPPLTEGMCNGTVVFSAVYTTI